MMKLKLHVLILFLFVYSTNTAFAQDTDMDGKADSVDLDDDNDGILDSDEQNCVLNIISPSAVVFNKDLFVGQNISGSGPQDEVHDGSNSIDNNFSTSTSFHDVDNSTTSGDATLIVEFAQTVPAGTVLHFYISRPFGSDDVNIESSTDNSTYVSENPLITVRSAVVRDITLQNDAKYIKIYNPEVAGGGNLDVFEIYYIDGLTCTDRDTDGDSIPDHLDTDSDGDSCPDAVEGNGSITEGNLDGNLRITGGVDSNGVPTAVAGGQLQGAALNKDLSICKDTDGDTYADIVDKDDDNDGILDVDEYGTCSTDGSKISFTSDNMVTDVDGVEVTYSRKLNDIKYEQLFYTGTGLFSANQTSWTDNGYTSHTITFGEPVYNFKMAFDYFDRISSDEYKKRDKVEFIITKEDGSTHTLTSDEFTLTNQTYGGNNVFLGEQGGAGTMTIDGVKEWITSVEIRYSNAGSSDDGDPEAPEILSMKDFTFCKAQDTDGDGTPDYLDLDSDNDGCPDALEGGGTYTGNDINADGSLNTNTYPVDGDGIPSGSSQTVADSTNDAVLACDSTNAEDDTLTTPHNSNASGNVLTNDTDPDNHTQQVTEAKDADGNTIPLGTATTINDSDGNPAGKITINSDGTFTFDPEDGFTGQVPPVTYEITDSTGAKDTANLSLEVEAPVPVTLSYFNAQAQGNSVLLTWATETEVNNARFEIFKSVDGVYFEYLADVDSKADAQGNSTQELTYDYLDEDVNNASTVYYRLKQVDYDGQSEVFPVRQVTLKGQAQISVFPNPVVSGGTITVSGLEINSIAIFDVRGKEISRTEYSAEKSVELPSDQMQTGMYIMVINNEISKKIVIE